MFPCDFKEIVSSQSCCQSLSHRFRSSTIPATWCRERESSNIQNRTTVAVYKLQFLMEAGRLATSGRTDRCKPREEGNEQSLRWQAFMPNSAKVADDKFGSYIIVIIPHVRSMHDVDDWWVNSYIWDGSIHAMRRSDLDSC